MGFSLFPIVFFRKIGYTIIVRCRHLRILNILFIIGFTLHLTSFFDAYMI